MSLIRFGSNSIECFHETEVQFIPYAFVLICGIFYKSPFLNLYGMCFVSKQSYINSCLNLFMDL